MNFKSTKGFTIVELMAALALFGIVLALGTKFYLNSQKQFHLRLMESESFQKLYIVDRWVEKQLKGEIQSCENGKVTFAGETVGLTEKTIKSHPHVLKIKFSCLEKDLIEEKLVPWKDAHQPALIEYEGLVSLGGKEMELIGSVLK